MEAMNTHITDAEVRDAMEMLAIVREMDEPLREKWLDYGSGMLDGYRIARRRDEPQRKEA